MTSSGPHHSDMGKRELRQMLTTILRASGQISGGPSGVPPHDFARMSAPISPPSARKLGEAVMPRPSFALSVVDDPSASAGRCSRSDDMAADLSNGACASTLHVGTFNYTTGPRPVQKVNSGVVTQTTGAAGVVEAAHRFSHGDVQVREEMRNRMQPDLRCRRRRDRCSFFLPTLWQAALRSLNSILM